MPDSDQKSKIMDAFYRTLFDLFIHLPIFEPTINLQTTYISGGRMDPMQKITPCLCFNGNAETAVNFYVSVFKDARIISSYPGPNNQPLMIQFVLAGSPYLALNGEQIFYSPKLFPYRSTAKIKLK
jgi:hypothetical protein